MTNDKTNNRTLILASGNPGKAREVAAVLAPHGVQVTRILERVPCFDVEEDGETFAENAASKALAAFAATGEASLADDSGLCVAALDGAPGVRSARYGGPGLEDRDRARRLLEALGDSPPPRRAWFRCALVAALPASWLRNPRTQGIHPELPESHRLVTVEGRLDGVIGFELRGDRGFGYDPVFEPEGFRGTTLAEIGSDEKNRISHRGRALASLVDLLIPIDQ